ncbi:hypothetical protein BON98_17185 [Escherichia coli]|uniref:hypothetical protein n=1 Tax=Escherichia coli TaxID=562 RepID=UPI000BDFAC62|nr:hypothetical protein [Escherichia coli]MCW1942350.1 hypothetical protein [Escherichia coli]TFA77379.1 hypothetical protein BON98_17185 [Escherichia coli]
MARQKKTVEVPGQESATGADLISDTTGEGVTQEKPRAEQEVIQQRVSTLLDDAALTERNTLLGTINEQGAAIIARFETLGYTDLADQQLTDNIEFLQLVKKATTAEPAAPLGYVTNDEGKRQPVTGKPVLTEHGWHVPG